MRPNINDILAKSRQPKAPHHLNDEEHRIQCACVNWFRYIYPKYRHLLFAVPNGGKRNITTAKYLKAEGVMPGVSDLILLVPTPFYHGLCIEMKTPKGKQSESQQAFQQLVSKQGYKYELCHSLDEFRTAITDYFFDLNPL